MIIQVLKIGTGQERVTLTQQCREELLGATRVYLGAIDLVARRRDVIYDPHTETTYLVFEPEYTWGAALAILFSYGWQVGDLPEWLSSDLAEL